MIGRLLLVVLVVFSALLASCSTEGQSSESLAASQETPDRTPIPGYRVTLPTLDEASSDLIPVGLNGDQTLQVPPLSTPMQAGLYSGGPKPGEKGPAVIVAHINANGDDGFFADLGSMREGDTVEVAAPDGQTNVFTVSRVAQVPKADFPTREVYSDTAGPELRLITCGGELDASEHNYLSNVVVYAQMTGQRPTAA